MKNDARTVGKAMNTLNLAMVEHINNPIPVPKWWPSKTNQRKLRAIADIEDIVRRVIDERRRLGEDRGDLLSMLLLSRDEGGGGMNDKELRDEAMTLFFAGHETTAIALSWMWYLLAKHPEVLAKLQRELEGVLGARSPKLEDLPKLPYLEMVVKESMRILPSVWAFMREPTCDVKLGEHTIPKGAVAFMSPYVTQHDARFFPEPEEFRPERFSKENERAIPKGAYVPFASGPRVCLGKSFAMMEARLILGTMVQKLKLELAPGFRLELLPKLSLRPKKGLPMSVRLRERAQERSQERATP